MMMNPNQKAKKKHPAKRNRIFKTASETIG